MDHTISNLLRIKEEINNNFSEINKNIKPKIIAVSKTFTEDKIIPLIDYGHIDFGENKVQEAMTKWSEIKEKYKNLKLAQKISQEQIKLQKNIKLLIQINLGDETQKGGVNIDNFEMLYKNCVQELKLNVIGIMCIPPNDNNTDRYFSKMNELKEKYNLDELSMGMSNDYSIALKYGSTFLRIGSKIFGPRN